MEGKQLHGDDGEDSLEAVDCLGDLEDLVREGLGLGVALLADDDRSAVAGRYLLQGVHAFLKKKKISYYYCVFLFADFYYKWYA